MTAIVHTIHLKDLEVYHMWKVMLVFISIELSKNAQSQFELDFFNDLEDKIEEEIFKIENEPG